MTLAISVDDIEAAAKVLKGQAVRTPLLEFVPLNERVGRRVFVKFEGAQHIGAFKFRGAYNRIAAIPENIRTNGVVACSSGNHAQGVAEAARRFGIKATIVMPADAPAMKLANTKRLGAEVVTYDRETESREDIAHGIAQKSGATFVAPYDDALVMAGQGTVGLEIIEQAAELDGEIGLVLCNCGGGGLIAGVSTAIKAKLPNVPVYGVEPEAFDDTARSLESGKRESVQAGAKSICDALLAPCPGELTFPVNQANLAGGLRVSDDEVRTAIRFAFEYMKLVIEPGGAVSLAAALAGKAPEGDGDLVVVVSGSNIDPVLFSEILTA